MTSRGRFAAITGFAIGLLAITACAGSKEAPQAGSDPETLAAIEAASTGAHRSEANIARNAARHPVETLDFFGLRRDMTVIEILPGGLWYTEILGPVLRDEGQLVVAGYDVTLPDQPEYRTRGHNYMVKRFAEESEIFGTPRIAKMTAPDSIDLGPPGSADMVLTFRSNHGWIREGGAEAAYAAFFEVLRPGGVLGVVQHRAGAATDTTKFNGYVPQEKVIELATNAGFVFEASSEINANPADTADYEGGVWTLPPSLRLGDEDREKYVAIGESDRMTLRFRKP
jgi:predicted methyltransferase